MVSGACNNPLGMECACGWGTEKGFACWRTSPSSLLVTGQCSEGHWLLSCPQILWEQRVLGGSSP